MAISPLSRSLVSSPSCSRTSGAEPVSTRTQGPSDLQGAKQGHAARRMFDTDGFDGPMDSKRAGALKAAGLNAGGLEEMAQELSKLVQMLSMASRMLGGEGGMDGQEASGVQGMGGEGAGVPELAGEGAGVPELAGEDAGVPELGGEAPAAPALQARAPVAPPSPVAQPQPSAPVAKAEGAAPAGSAPKGGNTMTFTNDGNSPMTIQFTPNAGGKAVDSVTLAPGSTQTVGFPEGWSGNFRSTSGDGTAATLGEVKFNGSDNQTFYDVSYIEGDNAAMTIQPEGGGKKSGSMDNFLESAPDAIKAKTADGKAYGIKKTTTSNVQDPGVVDFYRKRVGGDQGYVIPTDDASTLSTRSTQLAVHLRNLA